MKKKKRDGKRRWLLYGPRSSFRALKLNLFLCKSGRLAVLNGASSSHKTRLSFALISDGSPSPIHTNSSCSMGTDNSCPAESLPHYPFRARTSNSEADVSPSLSKDTISRTEYRNRGYSIRLALRCSGSLPEIREPVPRSAVVNIGTSLVTVMFQALDLETYPLLINILITALPQKASLAIRTSRRAMSMRALIQTVGGC